MLSVNRPPVQEATVTGRRPTQCRDILASQVCFAAGKKIAALEESIDGDGNRRPPLNKAALLLMDLIGALDEMRGFFAALRMTTFVLVPVILEKLYP
jgi:hypothetical protein